MQDVRRLRIFMNATELFTEHLWMIVCLIALAAGLTYAIFHWRKFDEGYEQGECADPERVARENPPDEWSKSHWVNCVEPPKITKT